MKKNYKKVLILGLIIFLLLQLYQPARNIALEQDLSADFTKIYHAPINVQTILRTSCYDCHSNNTNYPWYSNIQPVGLFMKHHIDEGNENLNFNEFGKYSKRKQNSKLKGIIEEIKTNDMPLTSYILIHRKTILSDNQKQEVMDWIQKTSDSLSSKQ